MKKILNNIFGFGLMEVLIAAGLAGGLALTIAKISQNASKVTKSTEANNEINMMMNDVAYILSNKENCMATIPPGTPESGANITNINRAGPPPVAKYTVGTPYGNGTFTITSIQTETTGSGTSLVLNINRNNSASLGAKSITKRIPLKTVNTSGSIASCFSDTDNMIASAVQKACQGNTARFDASTGECFHDVVGDPGDICGPNQAYKEIVTTSGTLRVRCQAALDALTCPDGKFINGIDPTGRPICTDLATSCTEGSFLKTLASGALACVVIPSCPVNTVLFSRPDGTFGCSPSICGANEYLQGINSNGTALCKTIPNGQCGSGQYVKEVKTDGTLVCDTVPAAASLPTIDYSFVDGFNAATSSWSRKTIMQIAEQICLKINGGTWDGLKCNLEGSGCLTKCPKAETMCNTDTSTIADGCGGYCNVTGTRECRTVCGVGLGASACTNPIGQETNLGTIGWEDCQHRCTWQFNSTKKKGCWIKASGNNICYCRVNGATWWPSPYTTNSRAGDCHKVFVD